MTDLVETLIGAAPATVEDPSAGLVHVTDHAARGSDRLLQQFKGQPRIEALLRAALDQVQDLEDALWSLIAGRALATAEGAQLDGIGRIVGEPRCGLSDDDDYRGVLRARILANRSDGQADTLLRIARLVLGSDAPTLTFQDLPPAACRIVEGEAIPRPPTLVAKLLRAAKAGGVRCLFEWSDQSVASSFRFADTAANEASSAQGWGTNTDPGVGGRLAGAME